MAYPFFTIGHSTRSIREFVDLLMPQEIKLVVDVRTIPRSRTNPQYNLEEFAKALAEFQINYEHIAALGGLRGRKWDVPTDVNAFWENQSFHNYADYAMSKEFRCGLARLRELGHVTRVWSCAQRQCGGAVIEGLLLTILWLPAKRYFTSWDQITLSGRALPMAPELGSAGSLTYPLTDDPDQTKNVHITAN